jgi:hypothetical protein
MVVRRQHMGMRNDGRVSGTMRSAHRCSAQCRTHGCQPPRMLPGHCGTCARSVESVQCRTLLTAAHARLRAAALMGLLTGAQHWITYLVQVVAVAGADHVCKEHLGRHSPHPLLYLLVKAGHSWRWKACTRITVSHCQRQSVSATHCRQSLAQCVPQCSSSGARCPACLKAPRARSHAHTARRLVTHQA